MDKEVVMKPINVGEDRACFLLTDLLRNQEVYHSVYPHGEREREREQEGGRRRERLEEREIGSGRVQYLGQM